MMKLFKHLAAAIAGACGIAARLAGGAGALMPAVYLSLLAAPWLGLAVVVWSENRAYERLAAQGRDRLTLYGAALSSELDKFRNIPVVLSGDPEVAALLRDSRPGRVDALDRRLQSLNASVGASAIYLLDRDGMTLAASNWAEGEGSFVGHQFAFRPYFLAAMQGERGGYFALGSTSHQPGYYFAMPVAGGKDEAAVGAVVVKMALDGLERGWSGGAERVFVTDRHGIIFITNTPAWRFHSLAPLPAEERRAVLDSRQYGDAPLAPLAAERRRGLLRIDGQSYVEASAPAGQGDWTLTALLDIREARRQARDLGLRVVLGLGLGIGGLLFLGQRRRLERRQTRELERRVAERTRELEARQNELVQAAKLAALGQMSAGMAHEINQPLAAIRSYAENARVFLARGQTGMVEENLGEITDLTERMARLTGQLKQFARKSAGEAVPVPLGRAVEAALALLAGRLRAEGVAVDWTPPSAGLRVLGDELRMQQVLVNLLRNGLDAMRGEMPEGRERRLSLLVEETAERVSLGLRDRGPGLSAEVLSHLFEPFFTTKPAGEGLGLGLAISDRILRDLGGRLSAANHPRGGAVFTMTLPRFIEEPTGAQR